GFIAFVTIWRWLPLDNWWVRADEFPRIQIMVLGIIAWVGMKVFFSEWELAQWILIVVLSGTLAFQLRMLLP
ncbi:endonuclease, partial [Psychrobacter proteolyticus]